ncbi:MAG: 1-(5-phosphoribosyl)-5-[(5-phosphoribosylamino)methylideneamino]imidazole-4-carboxamide isomerase, partial [Bacteroidetes bacterium]|nr:1-(5-phosphoribosyl)-5-[(5-phosphoribosylamino)methylideneamino]imidazole-4-carboxamide isomerase [Bacteroidota bacterium]
KDGMLQGPSFSLYQKIIKEYEEIKLIASGGVSSIQDLHQLKEMGCYATIVGKALYENKITLKELQPFIENIE